MARDGLGEEEALQRIQAQIPLPSKIRRADVEIDNSGDLVATRRQVERLAEDMKRLARCRWLLYRTLLVILVSVLLFVVLIWLAA